MCRLRQIQHVYSRCGHKYLLPDELVDCGGADCKFSSGHPSNCVPPQCITSCWQYKRFPEQIDLTFDRVCENCLLHSTGVAKAAGSSSRRAGAS